MYDKLSDTEFLKDLLEMMIQRGFGTLPAREMAIETLALMLKHHPDWKQTPPNDYELARLLRLSPRKVRGYLDEISFRNPLMDEETLKAQLRELLKTGERIKDGNYVAIEIDDGLVRAYARQLSRANMGIVEQGNAGSIIKLSGQQYATLCLALFEENDVQQLMDAVDKLTDDPGQAPAVVGKTLAAKAVERFVLAASDRAGQRSVDLAFTVLTGGLSELVAMPDRLRKLVGRSKI